MRLFLIYALGTSAVLIFARLLGAAAWFDKLPPGQRTSYIIVGLILLLGVVYFSEDVRAVQICAGLGFGSVAWYIVDHFIIIRNAPYKKFGHKEYHYWLSGALVLFTIIGLYTEDLQTLVYRIDRLDLGFLSFQTSAISNLQERSFADERSSATVQSLSFIHQLAPAIDSDRDYLYFVAGEDHEDRVSGLADRHLQAKAVIAGLLAPVAFCADQARLDNVDIDLIREKLRSIPLHLKQLLLSEQDPLASKEGWRKKILARHDELVRSVAGALKSFAGLPFDRKSCVKNMASPTHKFLFRDKPEWPFASFLPDLSDEPNINLVTAALFTFNKNTAAAIEMISRGEVTAEFRYNYDFLIASLLYHENRDASEFYPPLQRMLDGAAKQIKKIDGKMPDQGDGDVSLGKLKQRAEAVRSTVKNQIAYYLAQSVASGDESSLQWWRTAQTYAKDLDRTMEDPNLAPRTRAAVLDTQGFVILVAQARKGTRDINILRRAHGKLCEAREIITNALAKRPTDKDTETALTRSLSSVRRHVEFANTLLYKPEAC